MMVAERLLQNLLLRANQMANGIVITKCPPDLENTEMDIIKEEVRKYSGADIYFSKIEYQLPISFRNQETLPNKSKIIGFAGLANDTIFKRHLAEQYDLLYYQSFSDHHDYKVSHIEMIGKKLSDYEDQQVSIVTTEKDMVKLLDNTFLDHITSLPFYYLPIKHEFIQDGNVFDKLIFQSIKNYSNQAFT